MAECGNKDLLTTFDGRNVDMPCVPKFGVLDYCNNVDADIWVAKIEDLNRMCLNAWNQLMRKENELQDWTHTRKVRSLYDGLLARQKQLLDVPLSEIIIVADPDLQLRVARLVSMAIDMACLLEQLREAYKSLGGSPAKVPYIKRKSRPKSVVENLTGLVQPNKVVSDTTTKLVIGATIVGGLYVLRSPIERALLK